MTETLQMSWNKISEQCFEVWLQSIKIIRRIMRSWSGNVSMILSCDFVNCILAPVSLLKHSRPGYISYTRMRMDEFDKSAVPLSRLILSQHSPRAVLSTQSQKLAASRQCVQKSVDTSDDKNCHTDRHKMRMAEVYFGLQWLQQLLQFLRLLSFFSVTCVL